MKFLVVDDESIIRRTLKRVFERSGIEVLEAENGEEALKILSMQNNDIDLVLLDLIMPKIGGIQVLQEAKFSEKTKIVVMSAIVDENTLKILEGFNISRFYQKPFPDIFQFADEMRELCDPNNTTHTQQV